VQQNGGLSDARELSDDRGLAVTAVSIALAYNRSELEGIPCGWPMEGGADKDAWNRYARAYGQLNEAATRAAARLAAELGGVAEGATLEGRAGMVKHVSEYYPHCVSHRAFAAAAGLGWIGKHGLLVTPEFGPAVRLATVFLPGAIKGARQGDELAERGCDDCTACLDACPILKRATSQDDPDLYREGCLRRIRGLGLEADVCGICVRACYEAARTTKQQSKPPRSGLASRPV
jgi:epoxyqueuosine reductase QueG